ncbi:MAG TPA: hypothetical protein ENL20_10695, partial [Candidatus Cloacimonetes bacterium]|nr:hypothetical protein [Candidatus Cloacimonadota bacterium]
MKETFSRFVLTTLIQKVFKKLGKYIQEVLMSKKTTLFLLLFLTASLFSTNIEVSGTISTNTTWTGVDTVKVTGNITINNAVTLTIDPGIYVEFQGHYKLDVQGTLIAIGTSSNSITFTAANHSTGWNRIVFDNTPAANDSSKIVHCKLEYGKANLTDEERKGGAIYLNDFSKILISHSNFSNNYCTKEGGAIYGNYADIKIENSTFHNNIADDFDGGAFFFKYSNPLIVNNLIYDNDAYSGGGVYVFLCNGTFINNTISNNTASWDGGGVRFIQDGSTFKNTIIYGNTANIGEQIAIAHGNPGFYYCDIEGGIDAVYGSEYIGNYENCIDADPQFIGSGNHPYGLLEISPCINNGYPVTSVNDVGEYDLADNPRFLNSIIDIGAYEGLIEYDDFPGTALEFDGTDDYVNIGNDESLNFGNVLTIECWVKPNDLSGRQGIFSTRLDNESGSFQVEIGPGSNGSNRVAVAGVNTWVAETEDDVIAADEWFHIVYTRSGIMPEDQKLYINGEEQSLITNVSYEFLNNSSDKIIASGTNGGQLFNGIIDEMRVWNVVRSETELRENMH